MTLKKRERQGAHRRRRRKKNRMILIFIFNHNYIIGRLNSIACILIRKITLNIHRERENMTYMMLLFMCAFEIAKKNKIKFRSRHIFFFFFFYFICFIFRSSTYQFEKKNNNNQKKTTYRKCTF